MNKSILYNIFLFLSTLTRGLIEVFSLVLLYKMGYSFSNLLLFLFVLYGCGVFVNYFSLKIYYKFVLVASSIIYGLSFIFLSNMSNNLMSLFIFGVLLSSGSYSYHVIRHYLAMVMYNKKRDKTVSLILIMYLGTIIASLIGMFLIDKFNTNVVSIMVVVLSLISLIPIFYNENMVVSNCFNEDRVVISKEKFIFNILEQFKVLFLELQPLFLYIYIDNSIYYVGIFNVLVNIASLIVVYFLSNKLSIKYFKYYCFLLGTILILKLNIKSGIFLLVLAFFEGFFVKIYEKFSLDNLYNYDGNSSSKYLLLEETIFFSTKSIVILLYWFLNLNFNIIMYINVVGIIISGFFLKDLDKKRAIKLFKSNI